MAVLVFLNGKAVEVLHDQSVNRTKSLYVRESFTWVRVDKKKQGENWKASFVVLQIMRWRLKLENYFSSSAYRLNRYWWARDQRLSLPQMTLLHTDFNPIRRLYWPGYQYLLLIMEGSVANAVSKPNIISSIWAMSKLRSMAVD